MHVKNDLDITSIAFWGMLLRTLCSYFLVGILSAIIAIPAIIFLLIPVRWRYDNRLMYQLADWFFKKVLWSTFLPIEYIGKENIPSGPVIFVANHQSSLDIPLLGNLTQGEPHIWLALAWLTGTSLVLRFVLPRVAVLVDTSTRQRATRSLLQALRLMNDGKRRHLMIFPEGGRFIDGRVHDFYGGFGMLAKKTNRPVVPVYIEGVNKAYPPGAFFVRWHPIRVVIGEPMYYQQDDSDESFKQRVRGWFVDQTQQTS